LTLESDGDLGTVARIDEGAAAPIAFRKVSYRFCELDGLAA